MLDNMVGSNELMDPVPGRPLSNVDQGITELLDIVKEQLGGNRVTKANRVVFSLSQGANEDPFKSHLGLSAPGFWGSNIQPLMV